MADFRGIMINTLLISLFAIAVISIGINLAVNNGVDNVLLQNEKINKTYQDLNNSISDFSSTSNSKWNLLRSDNPEKINELTLLGITRLAVTLPSFLFTTITNILTLISSTLGVSPVVLYAFISIVTVVILTMIVSLIRSGR